MRTSFALALAAALSITAAQAGPCRALASVLAAAPKFEDFRVHARRIARPAPLDPGAGAQARRFRSALREAAKAGPNFAGHYTIAGWGCGTGCLDWGVIDAATGKVTFDAGLRGLENPSADWDRYEAATRAYAAQGANAAQFDLLLFKPGSALLVTLGAPREDEARDGIAWWRWTGTRFVRVHFVAAKTICRQG